MALIEKEPIMKFIEDGLNNKHYGHTGVEIITEVEFAPIIDATPVVHARWKTVPHVQRSLLFMCSNCGTHSHFKTNYCSDCGARMDKEKTGD